MKEYLLAEWSYRKIPMAIATVVYVLFFFLDAKWSEWRVDQFYMNTAIVFWISTGIMTTRAEKRRRDRLYSLIPIPRRIYSIARVVVVALTKLWLLLFWFAFLLVRPEGFAIDTFWYMLSFSMIAMIPIFIFVLYHDFGYFETWKYRIWMWVIGAAVLILLFTGGFSGRIIRWNVGHDALTNNPIAFAVYTALVLMLSVACVRVFLRRRSYVA